MFLQRHNDKKRNLRREGVRLNANVNMLSTLRATMSNHLQQ